MDTYCASVVIPTPTNLYHRLYCTTSPLVVGSDGAFLEIIIAGHQTLASVIKLGIAYR